MSIMRIISGTFVCLTFAVLAMAQEQPQQPGLAPDANLAGRKKIIFLSGRPSHGFAQHEHYAGCMFLARNLNENVPQVVAEVYKYEWPKDEHAFDNAAAIVIYCDGGGGHMAIPHLKQLSELMDKGIGLGCIHYAVELPKGEVGDDFVKWIGGYFEPGWSINPVWTATFDKFPQHAVSSGMHPFSTHDEWYYHMRFREEMKGVTPLLTAIPPQGLKGTDTSHNGTPELHEEKDVPQHLVWVAERANNGRGFGCTGGHYHFNWGSDEFRKGILNCIVWISHVDVPPDGVKSKTPTPDELLANLDGGNGKRRPANLTNESLQQQIDRMNSQRTAGK